MDSKHFIASIKKKRDLAVKNTLENLESPPGRKPHKKDILLSEFYNSLNSEQKQKVGHIVQESVDMGLFSFLCILDHVSFIENTEEKTQFELYAVKDGKRILLNDFDQELLHDTYNDLVLEEE